jgi:hypothetical protein
MPPFARIPWGCAPRAEGAFPAPAPEASWGEGYVTLPNRGIRAASCLPPFMVFAIEVGG